MFMKCALIDLRVSLYNVALQWNVHRIGCLDTSLALVNQIYVILYRVCSMSFSFTLRQVVMKSMSEVTSYCSLSHFS